MINASKLPIIAIATITILAAGGVVYLKIRPGPGKQVVTSTGKQPIYKETSENLTPAVKAAKRLFELDLAYYKTVSRNPEYKEVENDGYEGVVIVSAEIRQENGEWERRYDFIETKLVNNLWTTRNESMSIGEYGEDLDTADSLRAWRDVKFLGVKDVELINENSDKCSDSSNPVTIGAKVLLEIENKGDKERTVEFLSNGNIAYASEPANTLSCSAGSTRSINITNKEIKVEPNSTKTYTLTGKLYNPYGYSPCCRFLQSKPEEFKIYKIDNKIISNLWLEHPQYIP